MLVATWNLKQASATSARGAAQAERMETVGADVWVLTEASRGSVPTTHKGVSASNSMPGVEPAACFAIVTAASLQEIDIPEVPTAAAAVVPTSTGDRLVVGVCMPWRNNAPTLPPTAAPGENTGPGQWRHVLEQLDEAVCRLRATRPDIPLVIAGDFNQTLEGRHVGSIKGRAQLLAFLKKHELTAFTAEAPSAKEGCLSVDHIFGPAGSLDAVGSSVKGKVVTFPAIAEVAGSTGISDHLGYSVEIRR